MIYVYNKSIIFATMKEMHDRCGLNECSSLIGYKNAICIFIGWSAGACQILKSIKVFCRCAVCWGASGRYAHQAFATHNVRGFPCITTWLRKETYWSKALIIIILYRFTKCKHKCIHISFCVVNISAALCFCDAPAVLHRWLSSVVVASCYITTSRDAFIQSHSLYFPTGFIANTPDAFFILIIHFMK